MMSSNLLRSSSVVEKLARMTLEEANRHMSLTPPAGCRNSFSSCNDGKATCDDLHRMNWDGSSPRAGPGGSSPTVVPSRRGHYWTSIGGGSLLDADQQKILLPIWDLHAVSPVEGFPGALQRRLNQILTNLLAMV